MAAIRDIVFTIDTWNELRAHLLGKPRDKFQDEQLAFIFAAQNETMSGCRLVVHDLLLASKDDFIGQSAVGLTPSGAFVAKALSRCRAEGWSLIEAHSHPFDDSDRTTFSAIDWDSDRAKMPEVARIIPAPFYHATMVLGQRSLDAHYYDASTEDIVPIPRVTIVGRKNNEQAGIAYVDLVSSTSKSSFETEIRHDRQIPLLGTTTQEAFARTSIAVVGLGGLGSFVALQLAYLGIGDIALIDHDRVEETNLNRLLGARLDDVGRPKVEVFADAVASINPQARITAVSASIMTEEALMAAKSADILVGCLDNHGARLAINHLSVRYLIPLLDAGTGVHISDRTLAMGGQVQLVLPGAGCLECRGLIDRRQAAHDLASKAQREYEESHGYGTEEAAPSVIFLNGVVASLQVCELVKLLSGENRMVAVADIVVYDALKQRSFVVQASSHRDCLTCGKDGVLALADLAPLEPAVEGPVVPNYLINPPPDPALDVLSVSEVAEVIQE
ncbi:hypothetical protein CJ179_39160 [Rhodococcus sp. ACS1]|uniref:HesA/MoeB/ThiF family protein n=1 Tax=Rhodococcus sp. ACS1 TaxID=2028570 RepID=UPI000BB14314|nr:ThiF family adenylyltransferase [Rhodococcus sp. ACS1]PBC38610.1 hypothetical protein CJ179_39160 [Rhodococcus sp. ACS1]